MIGVSVGVDVDSGVGDFSGFANTGSFAGGGFVNTSLGIVCGADAGDASDDMEWRSLEYGMSTNKETAAHRAATMAKGNIQCPRRIDSLSCPAISVSRHSRSISASHSRRGVLARQQLRTPNEIVLRKWPCRRSVARLLGGGLAL